MSMTIEQMRAEVAKLYTGLKWKEKVAKMSKEQILAIYQRQVAWGRLRAPAVRDAASKKEWQPSQSAREGYRPTCDAVTATGKANTGGGTGNGR